MQQRLEGEVRGISEQWRLVVEDLDLSYLFLTIIY